VLAEPELVLGEVVLDGYRRVLSKKLRVPADRSESAVADPGSAALLEFLWVGARRSVAENRAVCAARVSTAPLPILWKPASTDLFGAASAALRQERARLEHARKVWRAIAEVRSG
jgi:hypothetical protein